MTTPTPIHPDNASAGTGRRRPIRTAIGTAVGVALGALVGYSIDAALTDEPFAGLRLGILLGGLIGSMIGGGHGFVGVAAMMITVACSAIGVAAPSLVFWLWRPVPMDHWLVVTLTFIGGLVGAILGLATGALLMVRRAGSGSPSSGPGGNAA
jgi:hypothetical protein